MIFSILIIKFEPTEKLLIANSEALRQNITISTVNTWTSGAIEQAISIPIDSNELYTGRHSARIAFLDNNPGSIAMFFLDSDKIKMNKHSDTGYLEMLKPK